MSVELAERIAQWIRHLEDPNAMVRQTAARWLGRWGTPQAMLPLLERLADPCSHVRWEAIRSLARLGDVRALPPLRLLTRIWGDEPDFIREAAQDAVVRITARVEAVSGRELAPVDEPPRGPKETDSRALTLVENHPPDSPPTSGRELA